MLRHCCRGWFNRLTGEGSGKFTIFAGASSGKGQACQNLNKKAGEMVISCQNSGSDAALFAFGKPNYYALDLHGVTLDQAGLDQVSGSVNSVAAALAGAATYNAPQHRMFALIQSAYGCLGHR